LNDLQCMFETPKGIRKFWVDNMFIIFQLVICSM
jgi:hypothetical protein